jgi:hypothetical protein
VRVSGAVGPALAFAAPDYVTMGDLPAFELPVYSWLFWVRGDELPGVSDEGNGQPLFNADQQFNFSWQHGQDDFTQAATHRSASGVQPVRIATPLAAATWYLVAASYDGVTLRIFRDGALEAERALSPPITAAGPFAIGNDPAYPRFSGQLDEVRVLGVARSSDWMTAEYLSMTDRLIAFGPEEAVEP